MTRLQALRLARKMADILFTNGAEPNPTRHIDRLEQKVGRIGAESAMGGWSERAVRDVLVRELLAADKRWTRRPRG